MDARDTGVKRLGKIFFLLSVTGAYMLMPMDKKIDPTSAASIRLPGSYWSKLRELMQTYGRKWLEKAIDREYSKFQGRGK